MALKENSKMVWQYLKDNAGNDTIILDDIAQATGLTVKQVNGCVLGLQRETEKKPAYAKRTPGKIEKPEGGTKDVKFISLTDAGLALDPDAE